MSNLEQKIIAQNEQIARLSEQANDTKSLAALTEMVIDHANVIAALDLKAYLKDVTDQNVIDFCDMLAAKRGAKNGNSY